MKIISVSRTILKHISVYLANEYLLSKNIGRYDFFKIYTQLHEYSEPVFFLSTGRCGTAFLTEFFEQSKGYEVNHNWQPAMLHHGKVAYENWEENSEILKHMIDSCRTEMMIDVLIRNNRYIETNPYITFFAYQLSELFPKAKFVHLIRNPKSFVSSTIQLGWYSGKRRYDMARIKPKNDRDYEGWSNVKKAGWNWSEYNTFIEGFKDKIDPKRVITVKSESLFANSETELTRILDFIGAQLPKSNLLKRFEGRKVNSSTKSTSSHILFEWNDEAKNDLASVVDPSLCSKYEYVI